MMNQDLVIRITAFVGVLVVMAIWELMAPRRRLHTSKAQRWVINLSLVGMNALLIRILPASGAFGAAIVAGQHKIGLLHQLDWPSWIEVMLAVILLDLVVYFQHVLMHAVPILWRLHMVHHSDLDFDVTTGIRFHPLEIVLSMFLKIGIVIVLGASPLAVLVFEVLLNATAMFNHSNVYIPAQVDRTLRWLVVTPDMHRIHHSVIPRETNRNFGFNLPWWDRLLGTYLDRPSKGQERMSIGLETYRNPAKLTWLRLMILPFTGSTGNYPTWHDEHHHVTAEEKAEEKKEKEDLPKRVR
ncbi:MAG: sterol desaturase family protein [Nitrospirales bacterium]|nr:sterol desaturase family protein [Nitrospira sp.]MDR4502923.1 sterol desaturase family protein [Nitrospirales bacterium]